MSRIPGEYQLDARRLLCPLPVIRTQDKIATLCGGDRLIICCTDPGALHDIPAWCEIHGHEVIEIAQSAADDGDIRIIVRVNG